MQWLDGAGKLQPLLAKPGPYWDPKLSPDGRRLAISITEGSNDNIWVYEAQRDAMTRLTFEAGGANWPLWTPDGQYVLFQAAGRNMYWTRADGAGKAQPLTLTTSPAPLFPGSVTADGKRLAYQQLGFGTLDDLWTVPLESNSTGVTAGKPEVFLQTPFNERDPSFSPTGDGWRTIRMSPAPFKSMCGLSLTRVANGRSPTPVVCFRYGRAMGASCSSLIWTTRSWWRPTL